MGWKTDLLMKAALRSGKAVSKRINGTNKVVWKCCGGEGDHVRGCDGFHEFHPGSNTDHSGEREMTQREFEDFKKGGGTFYTARRGGKGFIVHVKKESKRR